MWVLVGGVAMLTPAGLSSPAPRMSHMRTFDEGITNFQIVLDVTELGHTSPWSAKWTSGSGASNPPHGVAVGYMGLTNSAGLHNRKPR